MITGGKKTFKYQKTSFSYLLSPGEKLARWCSLWSTDVDGDNVDTKGSPDVFFGDDHYAVVVVK